MREDWQKESAAALAEAVEMLEGQTNFGKAIGATQTAVWKMLKKGMISPQYVRKAVQAVQARGGNIPRERFRPDIYFEQEAPQ